MPIIGSPGNTGALVTIEDVPTSADGTPGGYIRLVFTGCELETCVEVAADDTPVSLATRLNAGLTKIIRAAPSVF